jgi:hypothetical protein
MARPGGIGISAAYFLLGRAGLFRPNSAKTNPNEPNLFFLISQFCDLAAVHFRYCGFLASQPAIQHSVPSQL